VQKTDIEWCDYSSNPIRAENPATGHRGHYCEKVSPGCHCCYASTQNEAGHYPMSSTGVAYPAYPLGTKLPRPAARGRLEHYLNTNELRTWLNPNLKGKTIFPCDMTDIAGAWVSDEWLDIIFAYMALSPATFLVLTKRPERMREYLTRPYSEDMVYQTAWEMRPGGVGARSNPRTHPYDWQWPLRNVILMVSVENQRWADIRIPQLLATPAAAYGLSCEPLLGPLNLGFCPHISLTGTGRLAPAPNRGVWECDDCGAFIEDDAPMRHTGQPRRLMTQGPRPAVSWVIAGGESAGPAKRALVERWQEGIGPDAGWEWVPKAQSLLWIQNIRDQCVAAGVPFFFKQWPIPPHKPGGPALVDGREWRQFPGDARGDSADDSGASQRPKGAGAQPSLGGF